MTERIQTFTLSERGEGPLWLKQENEYSFPDETLLVVIEAERVLDVLEDVWKVICEGRAEVMPRVTTWAIGDILRDTGRISVEEMPKR